VSYLDRLAVIHDWDPSAYRPFLIDGQRVGRVQDATAQLLAPFTEVFTVTDSALYLAPSLAAADVDSRSAAVHGVLADLAEKGAVRRLRGETYAVAESWRAPTRMRLDRGAVPVLGTRSYGVHLNGYVPGTDGTVAGLWIGTRAPDKRVAPGKLDHLVAGGVSHGYGIQETLIKEAAEEADIPADLAARARPVGALSYVCEIEAGLRDDVLFIYDLALPESFVPRNTDGELTGFALWSLDDAMARVRDSDDFKFNVAPVMIDFFLRHGCLTPDSEPLYPEIAARMHAPGA